MRSSGLRGQAIVFPDILSARSRLTRRWAAVERSSLLALALAALVATVPSHLHAKCLPRACFVLELHVSACQSPSLPPPPTASTPPSYTMLSGTVTNAVSVSCTAGAPIAQETRSEQDALKRRSSFFYRQQGDEECAWLSGKRTVLFYSPACCDVIPAQGVCSLSGPLLRDIPPHALETASSILAQ
jgi:hypothetical protein